MKFNDDAFMRRLAHNENLLKTLAEQHRQAHEAVKEATKKMFQVQAKWEQQSAIVDRLQKEMMGI